MSGVGILGNASSMSLLASFSLGFCGSAHCCILGFATAGVGCFGLYRDAFGCFSAFCGISICFPLFQSPASSFSVVDFWQ